MRRSAKSSWTHDDSVVVVTYYERYYGIIIDIYGLTIEQVSTAMCN